MLYEQPYYDESYLVGDDDATLALKQAKLCINDVLNAVYVTGNINSLEESLEDLLVCFNMQLPKNDPVLERKETRDKKNLFNEFVSLTKDYAEKLKN